MPAVPTSQNARAILAITLAIFMFSLSDAASKALVGHYSVVQIIFLRATLSIILIGVWVLRSGGPRRLATKRPMMHVLRVIIGVSEVSLFYLALRTVPLADATAVYYAAPLISTALSVPFLGERVGPRRWAAIGLGFAGMILIAHPGSGAISPGIILVLFAVVLYALAMILNRLLSRTENTLSLVFYMLLGDIVVMGTLLPGYWTPPSVRDLAWMMGLGIITTGAHFSLVYAYSRAPVAVVSPFDYTALFWATVFGYVFWGDIPTLGVWIGALLVVAAGVYVVYREGKTQRAQAALKTARVHDHHE
ncbi:DMT family transporter [Varunaivibrio sulfuroxidans]|uniref:Drug/metabolite transporter (DMT)-like permease n=1 Tax=Varunaivibrio sulfuroxidans TaxID=1773489 RepID=A0A4R3JFU7_9PROT|nr:DMT family transporter [Varunaivibrio sulfuroxidans]TCS64066.1 drug/metabolite transporter (DMT)-like permease [Varunaivibrio sulfuroxidans]WES31483.1 DMT family transporter [Varunaivibrio sulfuroxidans]